MKKIIAIMLSFLIIMPTMVSADTIVSAELENVLISVKSKVEIPAELSVFENNVSEYNENKYYNFEWHTPNYNKAIGISADSEGHITNYYYRTDERTEKKLSGITKSEIISFADKFLKNVLPEMYTDKTDVLVFNEKSS